MTLTFSVCLTDSENCVIHMVLVGSMEVLIVFNVKAGGSRAEMNQSYESSCSRQKDLTDGIDYAGAVCHSEIDRSGAEKWNALLEMCSPTLGDQAQCSS